MRVKAQAVKCFLEKHTFTFFTPNRGSTYLASLADQEIALHKAELLPILGRKGHLGKLRQIEDAPPHVAISEVRIVAVASLLAPVKHLPEATIAEVAKLTLPPGKASFDVVVACEDEAGEDLDVPLVTIQCA